MNDGILREPMGDNNLIEAPGLDERNPEYALRLQEVLRNLDFPTEYIASIGS